jgi:hypothetical protein
VHEVRDPKYTHCSTDTYPANLQQSCRPCELSHWLLDRRRRGLRRQLEKPLQELHSAFLGQSQRYEYRFGELLRATLYSSPLAQKTLQLSVIACKSKRELLRSSLRSLHKIYGRMTMGICTSMQDFSIQCLQVAHTDHSLRLIQVGPANHIYSQHVCTLFSFTSV